MKDFWMQVNLGSSLEIERCFSFDSIIIYLLKVYGREFLKRRCGRLQAVLSNRIQLAPEGFQKKVLIILQITFFF